MISNKLSKTFNLFLEEQQITNLEETLRSLGYEDLKIKSKNSIGILTDKDRQITLQKLIEDLKEYNPKRSFSTKHSSIGHIEVEPKFEIFVKPKGKQGGLSAGLENEKKLVDYINELIKTNGKNIDVVFTDGKKEYLCIDVKNVKDVGRNTTKNKKADVILEGEKDYNISLKQDNSIFWESADKYYNQTAKKIIRKLVDLEKVKLREENNIYSITPNIAVEANEEEAEKVVFGSDIKDKGCIIVKTFNQDDFEFSEESNTLTIKVSNVVENLKDLEEDMKVYFLIRNDSTRKTKGFLPGLRIVAVYKSRISGKVIIISTSLIESLFS